MPEPYRVLVTGSRTWTDYAAIEDALSALLADVPEDRPFIVVHGACPQGADELASRWYSGMALAAGASVREERHPARWGEHGKAAGLRRNAEMVALGADVCLAFLAPCASAGCAKRGQHPSHGATHCADLAEKAGIEVRRFYA